MLSIKFHPFTIHKTKMDSSVIWIKLCGGHEHLNVKIDKYMYIHIHLDNSELIFLLCFTFKMYINEREFQYPYRRADWYSNNRLLHKRTHRIGAQIL